MSMWVPRNYKELLVRQAKELLRQCESLNGAESEDGFGGDQTRCVHNILHELRAIEGVAKTIPTIRFSELGAPITLAPERGRKGGGGGT